MVIERLVASRSQRRVRQRRAYCSTRRLRTTADYLAEGLLQKETITGSQRRTIPSLTLNPAPTTSVSSLTRHDDPRKCVHVALLDRLPTRLRECRLWLPDSKIRGLLD